MRKYIALGLLFSLVALADTPPPGTVKAKMFTGDGNTALTATGSSLNVNVTGGGGGGGTVDQGTAGTDPWFVSVRNNAPLPVNACQETGGNLDAILAKLDASIAVTGTFWQATQPVSGTFWQTTQPVSGTFWQATQPISAASLPLPSGASTAAKQPAFGTAGTASSDVLSVQGISGMTALKIDGSGVTQPVSGTFWQTTQPVSGTVTANAGTGIFTVDGSGHTQPVSGTFWQTTQPVSASSLPLPTGASTAAKQPALGTAGSASSDVITVQGVTSMTALKVDGSGVTQPVSGTFWQTTQPVSAASLPLPSGAATSANQSTEISSLATIATNTTNAGTPTVSGTVTVIQGTAGVSAWPVSAAQSGTWSSTVTQATGSNLHVVNDAGTAIVGKVGIDQTTPGTTNGVQVNAALPAGTNVIGKVSIDQTTPGTTNLVALAANQSVSLAQIAGNTTSTGNGTAGTGVQRVTIASDNTAFSVNTTPKTPTALTIKQAAVAVGTTAVRLTNDGSAPASTRILLVAQLLFSSTANCFLGSSGVTSSSTARGVQMLAGQTFSFNNDAGDYYAICDATSQTIFVTEQE